VSDNYANDRGNGPKRGISLASSGLVTALILALVLGALGVVWAAHMRGKIHRLTTTEVTPDTMTVVRPGGQDVLRVNRIEHADEMTPEFSNAVMLPGYGMALLQTALTIPGRGQSPLLEGTPEADLPGKIDPYTNAIKAGLLVSPISVRSQVGDGTHWGPAVELIKGRPAQQSSNDILPDGGTVNATFASAPPPGRDGHVLAPSGVETSISTLVTGRGLDLIISARNVSDTPRALSITWEPRFVAPAAGLKSMSVVVPETSGEAEAKASARTLALGTRDVHELYSNLRHTYLSLGPEVQLRNATDGYTLHLTALTPSIRSLRLDAAQDGKSVLLAFSTAAGDSPEQSHTVVAPGETLQWHVRVEATSTSTYTPTTE
jgi:aldose 1-epimerase